MSDRDTNLAAENERLVLDARLSAGERDEARRERYAALARAEAAEAKLADVRKRGVLPLLTALEQAEDADRDAEKWRAAAQEAVAQRDASLAREARLRETVLATLETPGRVGVLFSKEDVDRVRAALSDPTADAWLAERDAQMQRAQREVEECATSIVALGGDVPVPGEKP